MFWADERTELLSFYGGIVVLDAKRGQLGYILFIGGWVILGIDGGRVGEEGKSVDGGWVVVMTWWTGGLFQALKLGGDQEGT